MRLSKNLQISLLLITVFFASCVQEKNTSVDVDTAVDVTTEQVESVPITLLTGEASSTNCPTLINNAQSFTLLVTLEDAQYYFLNDKLELQQVNISPNSTIRSSIDGHTLLYQETLLHTIHTTNDFKAFIPNYTFEYSENLTIPFNPWFFNTDYIRLIDDSEKPVKTILHSIQDGTEIILPPETLNVPTRGNDKYFWPSPDLSRFLYYNSSEMPYSLWDAARQQDLWKSQDLTISENKIFYIDSSSVQWAFDSSFVAFIAYPPEEFGSGKTDLYTLSRDGELERHTYFSDQFDRFFITHIQLSPTNDRIAFYFAEVDEDIEQTIPELMVLGLENDSVTAYCINGYDMYQPWSPDGEWLATIAKDNDHSYISIIDLEENTRVDLPEGFCLHIDCLVAEQLSVSHILGWIQKENQ
jgi:hypothetical protein